MLSASCRVQSSCGERATYSPLPILSVVDGDGRSEWESEVEKLRAPIVNFVRVGAGCGLIRPVDYVIRHAFQLVGAVPLLIAARDLVVKARAMPRVPGFARRDLG